MTVGECLTNLMFAPITRLSDVKASCNWMWAAKLADEGNDYLFCLIGYLFCLLCFVLAFRFSYVSFGFLYFLFHC